MAMSLNCLTRQVLRTDSNCQCSSSRYEARKPRERPSMDLVEQNWLGTPAPPPCEPIRGGMGQAPAKKVKKSHPRLVATEAVLGLEATGVPGEPRLVRSCGMRRDWSFEDLRQRKRAERRSEGKR